MRATRPSLLAAVTAAVLLAGQAAAANLPSTTYVDKPGGYAVSIPKTWQLVPRSVKGVQAVITQLRKKKQTDLAAAYAAIISTASGRGELTTFRLQAFDWPALSSVQTDLSIGITPVPKGYGLAKLPAIAATFANQLASNKGSKVTVPKAITLASGLEAELIQGTVPGPTVGSPSTGFQLYLVLSPATHRLYELSFRIDARGLAQATLFRSIADHFKLV